MVEIDDAENVEESQFDRSNEGAHRIHTQKMIDTESCHEENIEPTVGNDESQTSLHNMDQSKAVSPNQLAPNRWHISTGAGASVPTNALASSRVPAATVEAATNLPYCSERETRLDFSKQAIEEFPFWEIA